MNALRTVSTANTSIDEHPNISNDSASTPQEDMEHLELHQKLNSIIETLPEQRRIIFKMIKEDELSAKQVAEILDISIRTVENQIYKAVNTLEAEITAYLGYSPRKSFSTSQKHFILILDVI